MRPGYALLSPLESKWNDELERRMTSVFVFGEFELDGGHLELRRHGRSIPVQPKVLRLLFYLVCNRHRTVTHKELMEALWPGEAVGPGSLKRAVHSARKALNESGESQVSIRTVRGIGYRFDRPIRDLGGQDEPSPDLPPLVAGVPARLWRPAGADGMGLTTTRHLPALDDVFVGRKGILEALHGRLVLAAAGHGRLALITGGPGLGKTRTVRELALEATRRGAHVLLTRGSDDSVTPPYWTWSELTQQCIEQRGAAKIRELTGPFVAEVAAMMPDLKPALGKVPPPASLGDAQARFRYFAGMLRLLGGISRQQPLVVVIEDLHLADDSSVRFLGHLARHLDQMPLLVVATMRTEPPRGGKWPAMLSGLARDDPGACHELGPLSHAELLRYLQLTTGWVPSQEVAQAFATHTGGHPELCHQILHVWRCAGRGLEAPAPDWFEGLAREQSIQLSLERHVARLVRRDREVLRTASILGTEFSLSALAEVAKLPASAVVAALSSAIAAGVLTDVPATVHRYRFARDLARLCLYEELSEQDRARLHGRAARVLQDGHGAHGGSAEQLAHHLCRAAPSHDEGQAVGFALKAASLESQRRNHLAAAGWYERALQLSAFEPHEGERHLNILLLHARASMRAGNTARAAELIDRALNLARQLEAWDALTGAVTLRAELGTPPSDAQQVATLNEALARLPPDDPRAPIVQASIAHALLHSGDISQRQKAAHKARETARTAGDPNAHARVARLCHGALPEPAFLSERLRLGEELMRLSRGCDDRELAAYAHVALLQDHLELGDIDAVERHHESLDTLAAHLKQPFFHWCTILLRATRAMIAGELYRAESLSLEARHIGERAGLEAADRIHATQIAEIWGFMGRLPEAETTLREVSSQYPPHPGWQCSLAALAVAQGRPTKAAAELSRLVADDLAALRRGPCSLGDLGTAADASARLQDARLAETLYDALLPYSERNATFAIGLATLGPVARHLGALAGCMERFDEAERHFRRALSLGRRIRSPIFIALANLCYGTMMLQRDVAGDKPRAQALIDEASSECEAIGARGVHVLWPAS